MDYGEKKNPLNAEILAEDANQGAGGIAALPTRVGRYGEAHRRALAMADSGPFCFAFGVTTSGFCFR